MMGEKATLCFLLALCLTHALVWPVTRASPTNEEENELSSYAYTAGKEDSTNATKDDDYTTQASSATTPRTPFWEDPPVEQEHEDAVLRDDPNGPQRAFHALVSDAGWNTLLDGVLQLESAESSALAALYNATEQRLQAAEDALYGTEERRRNVTHAVAELQHMWAELQALTEAIHPLATHRKAFNESDMPLLVEDLDRGRLFAADSKQLITNSSMSPYERALAKVRFASSGALSNALAQIPHALPLGEAAFTLAALSASGLAADRLLSANESTTVHQLHIAAAAGSVRARLALVERYATLRGVPYLLDEAMAHARAALPSLLAELDESGGAGVTNEPVLLRRQFIDGKYYPLGFEDTAPHVVQFEMDRANRGEVQAQNQMGYRMLLGYGHERDEAAAFQGFRAAAMGGDPYAMFNVGYMYLRGVHVPVDYARAMHWFRLAAAQDLPAAYNGLAILHYHGQGVPVNFTLAREMWHKGAALKDHDCLFNLGMMYNSGVGVEVDAAKALSYWDEGASLGSWRAMYQLVFSHSEGKGGVAVNLSAAANRYWQFMRLVKGWRDVLHYAAHAQREGDSWGAAVRYALLAEQGCSEGALNLGWLLYRGLGPRDAGKRLDYALSLFERAGRHQQPDGWVMLGHVQRAMAGRQHREEQGGAVTAAPSPAEVAVQGYRAAAGMGSVEGMFYLGRAHELGQGAELNLTRAAELYRQAIAAAEREEYAFAPWLALHALRVRVAVGQAGNAVLRMLLLSSGRRSAAAPAAAAEAQGGSGGGPAMAGGLSGLASLQPQWDTLLLAVLAAGLVAVLWVKRHRTMLAAAGAGAAPQQRELQRADDEQLSATAAPAVPSTSQDESSGSTDSQQQ